MNQEKIGKFISSMRKEKGYTQLELAKKLGVTDKAVSKWERGLCFPDMSLLVPISEIFGLTINELLIGEKSSKKNQENIEEVNKDILVYSSNEIKKTKKREKRFKWIVLIISLLFLLFAYFSMIRYYTNQKQEKELEKYVEHIEDNLKDLNFKKDNPLRSPNSILKIDNVTYVVPKFFYRSFSKNKMIKGLYKEILSYSDYENLTGIIVYFNGKEIDVHQYKTIGEKVNDMVSIQCNQDGSLIKKDRTEQEKEFYRDNKEEIQDRVYKIIMMWNSIYEY